MPKLARFTSRDPLPERRPMLLGASATQLSYDSLRNAFTRPYVYVVNNPVNLVDPSGMKHKCPVNKKADDQGGSMTGKCPEAWDPPGPDIQKYGCYCGKEPDPPRKSVPPPIDELDRCCCQHDNDYELVAKKKMTKKEADTRLCCCIKEARDHKKCQTTKCNIGANKVETFFKCGNLTDGVDCAECAKEGGDCSKVC